MSNFKHLVGNNITRKLRFLPYALVGIAIFTFNSTTGANPYLQVYVTLLEAKLGILLVYFLIKKLGNFHKDNSINTN